MHLEGRKWCCVHTAKRQGKMQSAYVWLGRELSHQNLYNVCNFWGDRDGPGVSWPQETILPADRPVCRVILFLPLCSMKKKRKFRQITSSLSILERKGAVNFC